MQDREKFFLDMFSRLGAIFKGSHFVYAKDGHGEDYVAKDLLGTYPEVQSMVGELASDLREFSPEVICGPELWGALLALATYLQYSRQKGPTRFCPIEKNHEGKEGDPPFILRRGYGKIVFGRRVAIVEDVLNTGGSARDASRAVELCGGEVVVVVALCNRGRVTAEQLGVPVVKALVNVDMEVLTEEECATRGPCSRGIPVRTDYGHGAQFLSKKQK